MANGRFDDDGSIADLPWASVFDPEINMRAVTAIQARGFRAASEVVNRLVRTADGNGRVDGQTPQASPQSAPEGNGLLSLWERLLGQMTRSLDGAGLTPGGVATLDFANTGTRNEVYLHANGSGQAVSEVWLHNGDQEGLGEVRMRCSDLFAHDGRVLDSSVVRFEPELVPMPARSSRGVRVTAYIAPNVRPGKYHGTLLADGQPDAWLPVILDVRQHAP